MLLSWKSDFLQLPFCIYVFLTLLFKMLSNEVNIKYFYSKFKACKFFPLLHVLMRNMKWLPMYICHHYICSVYIAVSKHGKPFHTSFIKRRLEKLEQKFHLYIVTQEHDCGPTRTYERNVQLILQIKIWYKLHRPFTNKMEWGS